MKKHELLAAALCLTACAAHQRAQPEVMPAPAPATVSTDAPGELPTTTDANVKTILSIYEVMTKERRSTPELFTEDAQFERPLSVMAPPGPVGVKEMEEINAQTFAMMSDLEARPLRIVDIGDLTYLAEVYITGTFDGELESTQGRPTIEPTNERIGMAMLVVFRFDEAGKVEHVVIWQNELAMLVDIGVIPPPSGKRSPDPPMPSTDTVVLKADPIPNSSLVNFYKRLEDTFQARPFDEEALGALVDDDVQFGLPVRPDDDKATWMKRSAMFASGLSEMSYDVKKAWTAGDDLVIVEVLSEATQTGKIGPFEATNRRAENHFVDFLRVRDGKLVALSGYGNALRVLKQLGHFPPEGGLGSGKAATPKGHAQQ